MNILVIKIFHQAILLLLSLCLCFSTLAQGEHATIDASDQTFDRISDTAYICYDNNKLTLLSTEKEPDYKSCQAVYGKCEADKCQLNINGAIKNLDKSLLRELAIDLNLLLEQDNETYSIFPASDSWPYPEMFSDPVCSWYHAMGVPCPQGAGLPGGGSPPGDDNGTPGTPGPNDNCWICSLAYTLCFAAAGVDPFAQAQCIFEFESCASKRCG